MRIEETKKGYSRVWLTTKAEKQRIIRYYDEQPIKQLAVKLQIKGGLRSEEPTRVSKDDIHESDEADLTRLKVRESKTGRRSTVIPHDLATQIRTVADLRPEMIDVTPRTIQNWVTEAAESIADETGEQDWKLLSAHDLRRTWATSLIQQGISESNVMTWGGWDNYETFKNHYFQQSDEQIAEQLQSVDEF
jgi:integrase